MFKTGSTNSLFDEFLSSYQSISQNNQPMSTRPFVYADQGEVRLVTDVLDVVGADHTDVCALTVAGDGWMEIFSLNEY